MGKVCLCTNFYKFAIVSIVLLLVLGTVCALIPYGKAAASFFGAAADQPITHMKGHSAFRSSKAVQGLQDKSMMDKLHHSPPKSKTDTSSAGAAKRTSQMSLADWWHPAIVEQEQPPAENRITQPVSDRSASSAA